MYTIHLQLKQVSMKYRRHNFAPEHVQGVCVTLHSPHVKHRTKNSIDAGDLYLSGKAYTYYSVHWYEPRSADRPLKETKDIMI